MQRNSHQILTEWLVLNAQSGKLAAMDELLKSWYPKFLRYSEQQLGNREAAKDVVQETLITVAKKIGRLKDPVAFPKWAYQILHRRGIDHQRREYRRRGHEVHDGNTDLVADPVAGPGLPADENEALVEALNSLEALSYNVIAYSGPK